MKKDELSAEIEKAAREGYPIGTFKDEDFLGDDAQLNKHGGSKDDKRMEHRS